jgi:uracil-DNA glycosylase
MTGESLERIAGEARACRLCEAQLPAGPRPVFQAGASARILVAGQAPGRRVHETGVPFNDPSGDRLRDWMGVDRGMFYNPALVAVVPMGFCYPGTGENGDLPPRPECAPLWRTRLLAAMPRIELVLAIGQFAIKWHLPDRASATLTETVRAWRGSGLGILPLPHPSPRNNLWLRRNPWFESEVVPEIRRRVSRILANA